MIKYVLLVYLLNASDGFIEMKQVSNIEYSSKVDCIVEMAKYKPIQGMIEYTCENSDNYFNKQSFIKCLNIAS